MSDSVYQVNVANTGNIHNHNNLTGAKFVYDCMPLLTFQQLKISRRTNEIPGYFQELKIH